MSRRPGWVRLGWWILGAAVLSGSAVLRIGMDGRAELSASETAWSDGDAAEATVHARRAASASFPGAPHAARAYVKLREIAEQSEARGDVEAALFAWRAIRGAAIGSRSWLTSHDEERSVADAAIARLAGVNRRTSLLGHQGSNGETSRAYRALLSADAPPLVGWGALLLVGAALWVVGGARLARKGFDHEGRFQAREARTAAVLGVAGLAAWFAGLLLR